MEHQLFPPKSVRVQRQRSSCTSRGTDIVVIFLCGLGLFLLFLILRPPSSPPHKIRRNSRKGQVQTRRRTTNKEKSRALKACRDCLEKLKEARGLVLLLQSYVGKLHDDSISHLSHWHLPRDECNPAPAGNKQPHRETEEDVSPDTLSPLASLAPPSQPPPPLAPFLPEEPQEVQSDMKRIPTGPVPENSPPRNSYLASLGTAIPGFDRLSSSISLFFWWWPTAKALLLLTSPHGRCQQEHLSYHPPEASLWGDATYRQVEAGGPSFISPAVQELLEMSISKRVELMLKAEEKTGLLLNQRYPSYILRSLGTLLRSLSNKQAATMPQPFWNLGNKPTQELGPQHLSYSEVFGDDLEQKYSQLFWGLPSLHSESLVATAWTPRKPSSARVPSVLFNGGSSFCPVQTHANAPPQLSQAQLLPSSHEAQCQPLTQNLSLPLGQFHTQAYLPKEPTPSSPQIGVNKVPCSPSQEKTMTDSSLPIKNQQMEWPLQKRLKQRKALISLFKNPKEVAVQSTPHFPQGIQASRINKTASTLPGDSINSQQEQLEQQSQTRLLTDEQDGPPCKFEDSQEETKPQGKCPQICHCQAMEKHDFSKPTRPWAYTGDPKVQESGFVCSKRPLSKAAGKVHQVTAKKDLDADDQEYLPWDSQGASVKVLEDHEEESRCGVTSPWECDCVNYKPKSPDKKHLKKALNVHLNKTLGQIKEGRIPVRVRRSWFVANHSLPKPNISSKHRKLIFLKSRPPSVNTSRKLSFLNPLTRFLLETHLKRFDARYGWFLLQKVHEGTNLNTEAKQASSLSQCTLPLSAVCAAEANVRTKIASYLGGRPENETREQRAEQSGQITERLFCPASPEPIKVQRVLTMRPTACTCGFSVAPATRQEPRLPATELVTSTPLGRSQLGRTDQRAGSPEWRPGPMIARSEPQDKSCRAALANPCYSLERHKTKRGSQPTMAEDISQRGKAKGKSHNWGATVGASVMTDTQAIDMSLSLKPQGSRKHSHPPRTSAVCSAGQLGQRAQGSNELEGQTEVDSEKPPPRQVAGITQQKGTALTFPTTDILASQASWVASQSLSNAKTSAPQGLNDRLSNAMSDQGQQEARIPNIIGPRKSESKMFISPDKRSKPEELKERAAKKRVTIAGGMSHPTRDKEPEVMPFLPQKVLTPPDIHVQQTMRPSLQWFSPTPKGTEWKDTLESGMPASATAQSHTPCLEKMITERKEAEAQAIITAVAKVLINKLGLQQQPGPAQLHQQKKEPQAMLLGRSCLRSGSSYPEKKRVVIDPAFIKLTTPKGLSRSVKSRWIEKENKLVSSPRELVSPASPSQHRLTVTRISSWHVHCPSNCLLQQDVSFGQTHHASSVFLSGKSFTPEKGPFLQRKST